MVSWHRLLPVCMIMIMRGCCRMRVADCGSAAAHSCNSQSSRRRGFATAAGCLTGGRIEKVKVPHGRLGSSRR